MIDISRTLKFSKQDKIFIDTNIWVFLYSPNFINNEEWQINKYSGIYENIIKSESEIYINSSVISEFINLCLKTDFNKIFNKGGDKNYKKDYRGSPEYINTYKIIIKILRKILKIPTIRIIDDSFSDMKIENLINDYVNADFNDLLIYHVCKKNNLKILTNDSDYILFKDIEIIR